MAKKKTTKVKVEQVEIEPVEEVVEEPTPEPKPVTVKVAERLFHYDDGRELEEVLTSVQESPDNAVVRYKVDPNGTREQHAAVVKGGVIYVHPHNVVGFLSAAPSFHYQEV